MIIHSFDDVIIELMTISSLAINRQGTYMYVYYVYNYMIYIQYIMLYSIYIYITVMTKCCNKLVYDQISKTIVYLKSCIILILSVGSVF